MPKTLRLSAVSIEEAENPRPHYSVKLRGAVTSTHCTSDPTAGLLPEGVVVNVRLSTDIGSDLEVVRKAACQRALVLLETLMSADNDIPDMSVARTATAEA